MAMNTVSKAARRGTRGATDTAKGIAEKTTDALPSDQLKASVQRLAAAVGQRAVSSVTDKLSGATGRLSDYAQGSGGPGLVGALTGLRKRGEGKSVASSAVSGLFAGAKEKVKSVAGDGMGAVTGALGMGEKGKKGKALKVTNIVEQIDVGVPIEVAYNQWTRFQEFPKFTKKVVDVEQMSDEKVSWTAKVMWSARTWESTIVDQVPDDHISWRSEGDKGYVDGVVTFHELAPNLTRVIVVLEYYPQGLFEKTGNIWRAPGRRARLELKNFQRHVMGHTLLNVDELEGWRGEIHDGEVTEQGPNGHARAEEEDDQPEPQRGRRSQARTGGSQTGSRRPAARRKAGTAARREGDAE
jgi:uncharacterized membrane protein